MNRFRLPAAFLLGCVASPWVLSAFAQDLEPEDQDQMQEVCPPCPPCLTEEQKAQIEAARLQVKQAQEQDQMQKGPTQ